MSVLKVYNTTKGQWEPVGPGPGLAAPAFAPVNGSPFNVLDTGIVSQIRAGRVWTVTDFNEAGLSQPLLLCNLADLSNIGSDGRALSNRGSVAFGGTGITGSNPVAQFDTSDKAFYINDSGAGDSLRLVRAGYWMVWFKTSRRGVTQMLIDKNAGYNLRITTGNVLQAFVWPNGTTTSATGTIDVCDDRWHFACAVADGKQLRLYVDGVLDGTVASGFTNEGTAPFNIGAQGANATTAGTSPFGGQIDEVAVGTDTLTLAQIRFLMGAKVPHGLGASPSAVQVNTKPRRKSTIYTAADFPEGAPKRLYNFENGLGDEGTNSVALTNNGGAIFVPGIDGGAAGAIKLVAASNQYLSASDTGLPTGTAARTMGGWVASSLNDANNRRLWIYGTAGAPFDVYTSTTGLKLTDGVNTFDTGLALRDGKPHFVVVVVDNAAAEKVKVYVDGKLVYSSTTALSGTTLAGAGGLGIGSYAPGSLSTYVSEGLIDGVFICDYAMTPNRIRTLLAKGYTASSWSEKNIGELVGWDSTNAYVLLTDADYEDQVEVQVSQTSALAAQQTVPIAAPKDIAPSGTAAANEAALAVSGAYTRITNSDGVQLETAVTTGAAPENWDFSGSVVVRSNSSSWAYITARLVMLDGAGNVVATGPSGSVQSSNTLANNGYVNAVVPSWPVTIPANTVRRVVMEAGNPSSATAVLYWRDSASTSANRLTAKPIPSAMPQPTLPQTNELKATLAGQQSYTFSGLDGDADVAYEIVVVGSYDVGVADSTVPSVKPNGTNRTGQNLMHQIWGDWPTTVPSQQEKWQQNAGISLARTWSGSQNTALRGAVSARGVLQSARNLTGLPSGSGASERTYHGTFQYRQLGVNYSALGGYTMGWVESGPTDNWTSLTFDMGAAFTGTILLRKLGSTQVVPAALAPNGGVSFPILNAAVAATVEPGGTLATSNFTSNGGRCYATVSGAGYRRSAAGGGQAGIDVLVDGVVKATITQYFNETESHKPIAEQNVDLGVLAAGNHTLTLRSYQMTSQPNGDDRFSATVFEVGGSLLTPVVPTIRTLPRRLYKFPSGALTDNGSGRKTLNNAGGSAVAGPVSSLGGWNFTQSSFQRLYASDGGLPSGAASRTMGAIVRATPNVVRWIMGYGTGSGESAYEIALNGTGKLTMDTWTSTRVTGTTTAGDGTWHLVAAIYDGDTVLLVVDGVVDTTASIGAINTVLSGGTGFVLGAYVGSTNAGSAHLGDIALPFVFDSCLDPRDLTINNLATVL